MLNNEDFLTSVYKNGLDVESGSVTYKNVDDLIAKYKSPPGLTQFEQIALGVVGSIVKAGLGGADKWLTSVIDDAVTSGLNEIGLIDDTAKVKTGLKLLGDQSDRILTAMGLKSSSTRPPNPSVIEAEMAMTGRIENDGPIGGNSSILLRTPGSLGTDLSETLSPWFNYPAYNEPLGTFALLDSPLVKRTIALSRELFPFEYGYEDPPGSLITYNSWIAEHARYRFEDIQYVFNPAAEVDEEKTVILGALVVVGGTATQVFEDYDYNQDISTYTYGVLDPNINLVQGLLRGSNQFYVSPFLELECLKDYIVGDFAPGAQVYLRLMIQYVFKENAYGKVNQAFEILTYPVKFSSLTLPPYTYFPDTLVVDGTTSFTQSTTLKARNVILVTGGLTLSPGVTVTLAAGREVLVTYPVTLPPNVNIEVGVEAILGCGYPDFSQIPVDSVRKFCLSSRYKANQLSNRVAAPDENPFDGADQKSPLSAYPNPFTQELTLAFSLDQPGATSARLIDHLGREVMQLWENQSAEAGAQEHTFNLSSLPAGLYLAVLETSQGRQTIRVVKE